MSKKFLIYNIVNLIIHTAFLTTMLVVTASHIVHGDKTGIITGIISIACWLSLIIFFDVKNIYKYYMSKETNRSDNNDS